MSEIEALVETCMESSHLTELPPSPSLVEQAKTNARYLYEQYRKVIPEDSLDGYRSHCWDASYSTQWNDTHYSGHIGETAFHGKMKDLDIHSKQYKDFSKRFPSHKFSTDRVCLPKVFLTGYPKCGSTFAHCFMNKIIYRSLYNFKTPLSSKKEPHFWVKSHKIPTAEMLGKYLFYYIPGMKQLHKSKAIFIDAKVNKMHLWPRFESSEHDLTNYCLLPAVIPKLIPGSKFVVIMRNPIAKLYSTFWFLCTYDNQPLPDIRTQLKGPELFHNLTLHKISVFNDCMRDRTVPAFSQACRLNKTYSSCIRQRLHLLERCIHQIMSIKSSSCFRSKLADGLYYAHVQKWLSINPREDFLFMTLEDLIHDPQHIAKEFLQFLSLKTDLSDSTMEIQRAIDTCGTNVQNQVNYHNDKRLQMRRETKVLLETFYSPFNALLSESIGISLPWKH